MIYKINDKFINEIPRKSEYNNIIKKYITSN